METANKEQQASLPDYINHLDHEVGRRQELLHHLDQITATLGGPFSSLAIKIDKLEIRVQGRDHVAQTPIETAPTVLSELQRHANQAQTDNNRLDFIVSRLRSLLKI